MDISLGGKQKPSLNEGWAAATCYLAAMEIAINKAMGDSKLSADENGDFSKRFNRLLKIQAEKGKPLTGLSKQLPQAFWKLRNDVIHGGYRPTPEELELIIRWVQEMTQSLGDNPRSQELESKTP